MKRKKRNVRVKVDAGLRSRNYQEWKAARASVKLLAENGEP